MMKTNQNLVITTVIQVKIRQCSSRKTLDQNVNKN